MIQLYKLLIDCHDDKSSRNDDAEKDCHDDKSSRNDDAEKDCHDDNICFSNSGYNQKFLIIKDPAYDIHKPR